MTNRERRLNEVIDSLIMHVEALGCTCASNEDHNKYHVNASRRRKDSRCTGVSLAVTADLRRRRAMRLKEKPE